MEATLFTEVVDRRHPQHPVTLYRAPAVIDIDDDDVHRTDSRIDIGGVPVGYPLAVGDIVVGRYRDRDSDTRWLCRVVDADIDPRGRFYRVRRLEATAPEAWVRLEDDDFRWVSSRPGRKQRSDDDPPAHPGGSTSAVKEPDVAAAGAGGAAQRPPSWAPGSQCLACGQGAYQARPEPVAAQDGDRVAVITDVPYARCPVCGDKVAEPRVEVLVGGWLHGMLSANICSVRAYQEIREESPALDGKIDAG